MPVLSALSAVVAVVVAVIDLLAAAGAEVAGAEVQTATVPGQRWMSMTKWRSHPCLNSSPTIFSSHEGCDVAKWRVYIKLS